MESVIVCTRCNFTRRLTPYNHDPARTFRQHVATARRLADTTGCPRCGDPGLIAEERDCFNRVLRSAS